MELQHEERSIARTPVPETATKGHPMTAPVLDPLAVIDTRDATWAPYTDDGAYHRLMEWAAQQGISDDVCRIEVYLLDAPFARVYEVDKETRILREPYDVLLSSLPPSA
ncbi:MAG: hypothetical protein ABR585_07445 [Gemmatimonadaceae bacterium]